MTMLQEQAIDMIKKLPDDKIYYIVNILESIEGLFMPKDSQKTEKAQKAQKAYQELQRYRKSSRVERDYKAELAEALEEKYENID